MKIRLDETGRVWAHCASVPAAVQERAASWTRIHTKQPRLLGDISKEARKALDNDPLVRCHARSRSHGPSNFLKKFRFIWLLHTPLQSKLFKTKFVSEMTTNLTSSGQYHLWKQCPTPRVAMSPWHLSTSMWVKVFLKEKFQPTPIWAWQSSKRNPYHNGPFWGIASNIPCPTWDEVVMLTLCSESLHRVHMASSVSLYYGKSGCPSNHPIRKHFWFTSRGTPAGASKIDGAWITKIWHFGERVERPMGDNPHLWISNLKFLVQMVAVWVEYLSDWVVFCRMLFGHEKTSTLCSILDEGGSECFL